MVSFTDLAREKTSAHYDVKRIELEYSFAAEEHCGPSGERYISFISPSIICDLGIKESLYFTRVISKALSLLCLNCRNAMVIGLGNGKMTVDSLGVKTAEQIAPTRLSKRRDGLSVIIPGVEESVGISAFETISSVIKTIKPDIAVAVDSLAARSLESLGRTVQLGNSGIAPGSGLGKRKHKLDRASLGIPVVSVGIPTVISASLFKETQSDMYVALSQSDAVVDIGAKMLSKAIESTFS